MRKELEQKPARRCPKCLRKKPTGKQEEKDWDF
jgi:hypothetical protein